ncbi:MAG: phosphatidylcholine/phosphatidylserine synthase [Verrucomicrobiota bacterium]
MRSLPTPPWLKSVHFNRLLPNAMTVSAIVLGLCAIRCAMNQRWEAAVVCVGVAALLDGLDGKVARMLKGSTRFGAELDSLSDFLCFGVVPAMLLYEWAMKDLGGIGWAFVVFFPVCSALRLARFNSELDIETQPNWKARFFTGVPSPAGAGIVLLPMIFSFDIGGDLARRPWVAAAFLLGVGLMLISRVPTYRKVGVPMVWVVPVLAIILAAVAVKAIWAVLSLAILVYLASLPFSAARYRVFALKEG